MLKSDHEAHGVGLPFGWRDGETIWEQRKIEDEIRDKKFAKEASKKICRIAPPWTIE